MQGILYEEPTVWLFLLITVILGGSAAWQAGRAVAQTWRPFVAIVPYAMLLAIAVRFLHFALFEGTLLSLHYYAVDLVVLLVASVIGWRLKRASQMTTQYRWLYEPAGALNWRTRGAQNN